MRQASNSQQIPWTSSSVEGEFYFVPTAVDPASTASANPTPQTPYIAPALDTEMALTLGTTALVMVRIPAGRFQMGSASGNNNEAPPHDVAIRRSFWMGKFPVTQGQFQAVMGYNPSGFKGCGPEAPVEKVTGADCQGFIARLNEKHPEWLFRLPSEAEWE